MAAAAMQPASRGQMMRATREQIRGWMTPSERMYSVQVYSMYSTSVQCRKLVYLHRGCGPGGWAVAPPGGCESPGQTGAERRGDKPGSGRAPTQDLEIEWRVKISFKIVIYASKFFICQF